MNESPPLSDEAPGRNRMMANCQFLKKKREMSQMSNEKAHNSLCYGILIV